MYLTADFETTTDELDCRVWAWGLCNINDTEQFYFGTTIDGFIDQCRYENHTIYFHNLRFDGEFILIWLFENNFKYVRERKELSNNTFTTLISDKGQFYSIEIMFSKQEKKSYKLTIYDSLKILPFSVDQIAKGFNLPISKLSIDYHEKRELGHILTNQEKEYLKNDVRIVAMALQVLFSQNLRQMTQGSNAFHNYKSIVGMKNFKHWFPIPNYDKAVRKSYRGGFTYLNPLYKNVDIKEGIVLDVNSLYPSVMYYDKLPFGEGVYFTGEYEPDELYNIYTQKLVCQFEIKPNHIPTIQLKHTAGFIPTQYVTSSDGEDIELCLTSVDLKLFFEQYDVYNIEYIDGWKFKSTVGLFKDYIDKWMKVKIESTKNGNYAMRTLAKLMLNALYGKFALNPKIADKYPTYNNGSIKYITGAEQERDPIYIPVGTFVTAYARYKTITSAQTVYERFIYADTDSLHLIGTELPNGLEISKTELGKWKHESTFVRARFLRQKSYAEETEISENEWYKLIEEETPMSLLRKEENRYFCTKITCAGMPKQCYKYVTWDNFHEGGNYFGKLQPKHVKGGIILKNIDFTIKHG